MDGCIGFQQDFDNYNQVQFDGEDQIDNDEYI